MADAADAAAVARGRPAPRGQRRRARRDDARRRVRRRRANPRGGGRDIARAAARRARRRVRRPHRHGRRRALGRRLRRVRVGRRSGGCAFASRANRAGGRRVAAHRRAAARRDFAARARAARRMRVGAHPHARFDTRFDTRFGARSDARIPRVRAASRFAEPRAAEPQRERPVPRRMRHGHPARRARRLAVALRLFPRVGALRFGVVAVASVVALAERRAALLAIRALQIGRPPRVRLLRGLDARDDRRDRRAIADG
ncbi:hypothetical protein DP55_3875 [Burkholderia pseudomallei]|nr:hypothetical protein DP55_3875 [Burkholderia pseudomallei]